MDLRGDELPRVGATLPGAAGQALAERLAQVECPALTARRARRGERSGVPHDPISWVAARGANVRDADGNLYVDLTGGFGVAQAGHGLPEVVEAVQAQAARLMHALGDVQPSDRKVQLLERLCALAPWEARAILGLSGADAVEAALKTALLHTGEPGVLAFEGGYHGLSHGPLATCGYSEGFRAPFAAQLNPHVTFAPFPAPDAPLDAAMAAVEASAVALPKLGAVLVEPIQGRGGVRCPPAGFLRRLGDWARARGALLIVDEIYTGLHRCGPLWLHQAQKAEADLLCTGKALAGGMPVSACLGRASVMAAWGQPDGEALHTSTFLGNPLGCAAALAHLETLTHPEHAARVGQTAAALRVALAPVAQRHGLGLRGQGLLLGLSLGDGGRSLRLVRALLERGFLTLPAGQRAEALGLTPPACLSQAQIEAFAAALDDALQRDTQGMNAGDGP